MHAAIVERHGRDTYVARAAIVDRGSSFGGPAHGSYEFFPIRPTGVEAGPRCDFDSADKKSRVHVIASRFDEKKGPPLGDRGCESCEKLTDGFCRLNVATQIEVITS